MMRILKFAAAFLGTFLLIFLIVFGFNMNALFTLFENSGDIQEGQEWVANTKSLKGLTEYIAAQPERVSIASLALDNPDSSILYNEHTPRTMGRLSNIFLAIDYAWLVETGQLNPYERVPLSNISRRQLPYIDASNHRDAIEWLRENGKVSDLGSVSISDLVQVAIEYSDLAAHDYLYSNFDKRRLEDLIDALGMDETESPLPFSGLYITLHPGLHNTTFEARMDTLSSLSRTAFDSLVVHNFTRFTWDREFQLRVKEQFREDEGLGIGFKEMRDALALFPKTTASDMAGLMKKIYEGNAVSKAVSARVREILSWPLKNSRLRQDFRDYGAIYDSRLGMAAGIDYGSSTYSGEPFAQAVLFDDLQVAFWFHMSSNLMQQDFQQRLIWDPALRKATVQEIQKN